MEYEINIAQNGRHYCEVKSNSELNKDEAIALFNDLAARFSKSQGFSLCLKATETYSQYIMEI